jgi:hypothetical protein
MHLFDAEAGVLPQFQKKIYSGNDDGETGSPKGTLNAQASSSWT